MSPDTEKLFIKLQDVLVEHRDRITKLESEVKRLRETYVKGAITAVKAPPPSVSDFDEEPSP